MDRARFKDAIWFKKAQNITPLIGGVGGIGSYLTFFLSRIGCYCAVYDDDIVEEINLGGQLYGQNEVGKSKVEAIENIVKNFSDENMYTFNEKYTENSMHNSVVFSCFDNMKARKDMFNNWKKNYSEEKQAIFIDGRLLMEEFQIFCIQGRDKDSIEKYEKEYLFDDNEVPDVGCTLKQTSHIAAMIASFMTGYFTNFLSNLEANDDIREVPFYTSYNLSLNLLS